MRKEKREREKLGLACKYLHSNDDTRERQTKRERETQQLEREQNLYISKYLKKEKKKQKHMILKIYILICIYKVNIYV